MESEAGDITVLLRKWKAGDAEARDQLMPHVYPHLHEVAAAYLRRESGDHTLQPTALVHELYLRLLQQRKPDWDDRVHFYAFAASVMRRILMDHARATHADKRGAGVQHVPLCDEVPWVNLNSVDVLDLNRALDELDSVDARKVRLVELRYFLGCTLEESAELLGISRATAERDLTLARTWLYSRLVLKKDRESASELPGAESS
ncbi:MAG TPA: sigma-70 family RNA polymerase sigma factor [Bryobacteraceae bacterium]|jgi:RNA polymerase sigma factor (TIGR02999 family)|nr:sigma-70 family RNA polymerase sigma factor [Bryobacteraceae bacterium]